jgi:hypothetical protein
LCQWQIAVEKAADLSKHSAGLLFDVWSGEILACSKKRSPQTACETQQNQWPDFTDPAIPQGAGI